VCQKRRFTVAAKAGSTAFDGDSQGSRFTAALVKYLTRPGLDLRKACCFRSGK